VYADSFPAKSSAIVLGEIADATELLLAACSRIQFSCTRSTSQESGGA